MERADRLLQEREYRPSGALARVEVDICIISANHRNPWWRQRLRSYPDGFRRRPEGLTGNVLRPEANQRPLREHTLKRSHGHNAMIVQAYRTNLKLENLSILGKPNRSQSRGGLALNVLSGKT
jgi:hypothetical protein